MNTTTHLARHLLAMKPNKDASRLCFYHYLIHHCSPETPLTAKLFEDFCRMALVHDYWRENTRILSQELQFILQHYNETFMLNWNFSDFIFPDHWQIVSIKNPVEVIYILERWVKKNFQPDQKNRVFRTKDQNYLALVQSNTGELRVFWFSPQMLIQKAELEPLNTAIQLQYGEDLELKPNVSQYLKVEKNTYARFQILENGIKGRLIRGYTFQNHLEVEGAVNEYPDIYYPLKKMEQFYIDPKSDPDYQDLVGVLQKSLELLKMVHPEAEGFAGTALKRGRLALKHIFIKDNVIQSLVDQLEEELSS